MPQNRFLQAVGIENSEETCKLLKQVPLGIHNNIVTYGMLFPLLFLGNDGIRP